MRIATLTKAFSMKRLWFLFAQVVTVLLAAYFVVGTLKPQWLGQATSSLGTVSIFEAPVPELGTTAVGSFSAAVKRAAPAVVSINTSKTSRHPAANDPWFRFFFGDQGEQQQTGLGSGVIMSPQGYVLTNNHVVEGADEIEVVLTDARRAPAAVIGTDPESDLAVLKIDLDKLPVIVLGSSDHVQVGDRVLAIGNPFGKGKKVSGGKLFDIG